jgi:hypothetical protein
MGWVRRGTDLTIFRAGSAGYAPTNASAITQHNQTRNITSRFTTVTVFLVRGINILFYQRYVATVVRLPKRSAMEIRPSYLVSYGRPALRFTRFV